MQYRDGHISTHFNKDTHDIYIYCEYARASYLLLIIYSFVLFYPFLNVNLFHALFDYYFVVFILIDSLFIHCSKEKEQF